jgi:competence protein ComGC
MMFESITALFLFLKLKPYITEVLGNMKIKHSLQQGFTLVEMLVIAPIVVLAIGAFLTVIISMTGEVLSSRGANTLTYNVQDALNRIDQDVKLSTTFLATNNITLTAGEAQGYNNDATNFTNVGGTSGTSLILNALATDDNPTVLTSGIVYQVDKPFPCSSTRVPSNTPMNINIVYFIKDNTLWRRTIMPSNYNIGTSVYCTTPWQQPSCAPGYTAVFCKTNDIKLVEGVSSSGFNVQYFTSASAGSADTTASNTAASVTARGTALQSLPTVGVSIIASQNIAGRTIERAASLRSTRLDTNASTIANYVAPTTPVAPTLSGAIASSAPTSVVYTWPKVDGADSYTFQYNFNGGAWQTPITNQNVNTYTVEASYHNRIVNTRVTATNTAGTSGYGTNTTTVPLWTTPVLLNSWNDYGSTFAGARFTKTSEGVVVLSGLIKRTGAAVGGEALFQLPSGYRPSSRQLFTTITNANVQSRVDVESDGIVRIQAANAGYLSLDGIKFIPTTTGLTFTALPMVNSWVNFDAGNHQQAGYTKDTLNRTFLRGLIKNGSTTTASLISSIAATYTSPSYLHLPVVSSTGFGMMSPSQTNATYPGAGLQYKLGGNGYFSIESMFYNNYTGWTTITTPTPTNWTWYSSAGIFSTPAYIKASDGIVSLKGLITGGTTTTETIITTLPATYRPSSRLVFEVANNGAVGRVDVLPNGEVRIITGGNTWLDLSNIHFIGEV